MKMQIIFYGVVASCLRCKAWIVEFLTIIDFRIEGSQMRCRLKKRWLLIAILRKSVIDLKFNIKIYKKTYLLRSGLDSRASFALLLCLFLQGISWWERYKVAREIGLLLVRLIKRRGQVDVLVLADLGSLLNAYLTISDLS
jgi:hypothetical protein